MMIMLDENSYPSESLLDAKMAPLQGPSLIVANDALFTEADFKSTYNLVIDRVEWQMGGGR